MGMSAALADGLPGLQHELAAVLREGLGAAGSAARDELSRIGPALAGVASAVASEAAEGLLAHKDEIVVLVARSARQAGREFSRGATEEFLNVLQDRIGPDGLGPLATAMAAAEERSGTAQLRGAMKTMSESLATICPPDKRPDCMFDLARAYSRSISAGLAEGVSGGLNPWQIGIAASAGMFVGLKVAWLMAGVMYRRQSVLAQRFKRRRRRPGHSGP